MNILKRELKAGLKPFLFWLLGLFVLVFAGITKFTGISAGGDAVKDLVASMPRMVMALMGSVGLDLTTLGGYYGILSFFSILCAAIYGGYLGGNAVSREAIDKTYEFVFTKPRSRSFILGMKLVSGLIYYTAFCLFNYIFSILAVAVLDVESDLNRQMLLFSVAIYLSGLIFFGASAMYSAAVKEAEKASRYSTRTILLTFAVGVVVDMLENPGILRIFSPFKYFPSVDLLESHMNVAYILLSLLLLVVTMVITFRCFEKRDLNAA